MYEFIVFLVIFNFREHWHQMFAVKYAILYDSQQRCYVVKVFIILTIIEVITLLAFYNSISSSAPTVQFACNECHTHSVHEQYGTRRSWRRSANQISVSLQCAAKNNTQRKMKFIEK